MDINQIADQIAAEFQHKDRKLALLAARAALAELPTPAGLIYDERNLPNEIADTISDTVRSQLEQVGGVDPLAKVKESHRKVAEAQDHLDAERQAHHENIRAARGIGVPFKDLQAATGFSRGYLHEVIKGLK